MTEREIFGPYRTPGGLAQERTPHSRRELNDSLAFLFKTVHPAPFVHPSLAHQSPRCRGSGGEAR